MIDFIKKYWDYFFLAVLVFIVGFLIGLGVNDFAFFSFDHEVSISDLANLCLTLVVGLLIPLSLSPVITNKRVIKDFIIDDIKDCIAFLGSIKSEVDNLALSGVTKKRG